MIADWLIGLIPENDHANNSENNMVWLCIYCAFQDLKSRVHNNKKEGNYANPSKAKAYPLDCAPHGSHSRNLS